MSTEIKMRVLLGFLALCVVALGVQGYFLLRMDERLQIVSGSDDIPASIQRRLQEQLSDDPVVTVPGGSLGTMPAWDPFARMQQMQQQMDSLFNQFSPLAVGSSGPFGSSVQRYNFRSGMPQLELTETETEYQLRVQTPPGQDLVLNSELEGNLLTVTGTLSSNHSQHNAGIASSLVSSSQFSRSFDLAAPVDEFGVYTEQSEAGLTVHVPKA